MEMKIAGIIRDVDVSASVCHSNMVSVDVTLKPDDGEQDWRRMKVVVEKQLAHDWLKQVGRKAEIILTVLEEGANEDTAAERT